MFSILPIFTLQFLVVNYFRIINKSFCLNFKTLPSINLTEISNLGAVAPDTLHPTLFIFKLFLLPGRALLCCN